MNILNLKVGDLVSAPDRVGSYDLGNYNKNYVIKSINVDTITTTGSNLIPLNGLILIPEETLSYEFEVGDLVTWDGRCYNYKIRSICNEIAVVDSCNIRICELILVLSKSDLQKLGIK